MLALLPLAASADFTPTAYYTVDGVEMEETSAINDAQAPLKVEFRANPEGLDGTATVTYSWQFKKGTEAEPFLTRYEENTTYEFREAGLTTVTLLVAYGTDDPEPIASIRVNVANSLLEMPNAFSPNGDGINDVYKAKSNHKSIIEFHAYIFNRSGQKLYDWTDIESGWDGTHGGKPVPDGVYYVLVKAKGADGREYKIKRDVNILRRYTEETTPQN